MNRRIAAAVIAATAVLGLAACSSSSSEPAAPPAPAASEPAPAAETGTGQSVAEACLELAGPMSEASEAMARIASTGASDPQSAVDVWTELADAFQSFAGSVSNDEVTTAATAAATDIAAVRDAMQKVYVDGETSAMGDVTAATTAMQTSYTALITLCTP